MKYLREIFSIFFLLIIAFICFTIFVLNSKIGLRNPFQSKYKFLYPDKIAVDSKENFYIIDNGWKRITKLNKYGKVLFTIDGGVRDNKRFYFANDIAVDDNDNLYIWNYSQKKDGEVEYQEIKKYNPDGKYDRTIIKFVSSAKELKNEKVDFISTEDLKIFYLYNNSVYFLSKDLYKNILTLYQIDKNNIKKILSLQNFGEIIDMKATYDGKVYITEIKGRLYELYDKKIEPIEEPNFIQKPWILGVDKKNNLYFTDLIRGDIVKVTGDSAKSLIERKNIKKILNTENLLIKNISVSKDGRVFSVDEHSNSIIIINENGNIDRIIREGFYPFYVFFATILIWGVLIFGIVLLIYALLIFYLNILNKKIPVVLKQLLVFIPVIIVSSLLISSKIYKDFYKRYEASIKNQLFLMAQAGGNYIDGAVIDNINSASDAGNSSHEYLKRQMAELITDDTWSKKFYSVIYKVKNNVYYIIGARNDYYGTFFPYSYVQNAHKIAYEKGKIEYSKFSDSLGEWMIAVSPIKDRQGNIKGVYEVGVNLYIFKEADRKFVEYLIIAISLLTFGFILIFSIFSYFILEPIQKLRNAVSKITAGDYSATVSINTKDEIGELCRGFNIMTNHIKNYIEEINELNKVYFKFVPKEFIKYIDKKNIIDIKLGDQVQKEMTIMFTDIRSFTTLSETMTPKENFDFINAYLRRVGPVIRKYDGFIDKYIGDAIMAIFPNNPENALKAVIEIKEKIEEYNIKRIKKGYKPINIGTGIHTGNLMFGIVGEEERMSGTVISDNVNLASRLEGLTKQFGAMAIISGVTLKKIGDLKNYNIRFLGKVIVKGKSEVVEIYEIIDSKNAETGKLKLKTKEIFEEGLNLYYNKKINEAFEKFNEVYKENRYDKAAYFYINKCNEILKNGIPENWDGIEKMESK